MSFSAKLKAFVRGYGRKVPVRDTRLVPPRQPSWQTRQPEPEAPDRWWNRRRVVYPAIALVVIALAVVANGQKNEDEPQRLVAATSTPTPSQTQPVTPQRNVAPAPAPVYSVTTQPPYVSCSDAVAARADPVFLNEPGYSLALDIEGGKPQDGIACEPTLPAAGGLVYYENCSAVRDAGAAPIRSGDPGYSLDLDRDGDGIACEWS